MLQLLARCTPRGLRLFRGYALSAYTYSSGSGSGVLEAGASWGAEQNPELAHTAYIASIFSLPCRTAPRELQLLPETVPARLPAGQSGKLTELRDSLQPYYRVFLLLSQSRERRQIVSDSGATCHILTDGVAHTSETHLNHVRHSNRQCPQLA